MRFSAQQPINTAILIGSVGSILLLALHVYSNWNGLGLTADSYAYLDQALFFRETLSFRPSEVHPLFPFQTFLIMFLAIFPDTSSALQSMAHVNMILLLFNFGLLVYLALKVITEPAHVLFFAIAIMFSTPLLMTHSFLWTESFFIFTSTLLILLLYRYTLMPSVVNLASLALLFVLLCLQRKAGLLILAGTGTGFILFLNTWPLKRKFMLLLIASFTVLLLYGFSGGVNLIGELPTTVNLKEHIFSYLNFLSAWLLPLTIPVIIRIPLLLLTLGFMVLSIFHQSNEEKHAAFLKIIFTIFITYCTIRLFYFRPDSSEMDRYLAPVYSIFFLLLAGSIQQWVSNSSAIIKRLVIMVMMLWILYPALRTARNANLWHNRNPDQVIEVGTLQNSSLQKP